MSDAPNSISARRSAPEPAGGAYSAFPEPLYIAVFEALTSEGREGKRKEWRREEKGRKKGREGKELKRVMVGIEGKGVEKALVPTTTKGGGRGLDRRQDNRGKGEGFGGPMSNHRCNKR